MELKASTVIAAGGTVFSINEINAFSLSSRFNEASSVFFYLKKRKGKARQKNITAAMTKV
jgi:hypothetical protein